MQEPTAPTPSGIVAVPVAIRGDAVTSHLPPKRQPAEVHPECLGDAICAHWQMRRVTGFMAETMSALLGGVQATRITHYKGDEKHCTFLSGEHPDGLCADGHDLVLERWVREVMEAEGCTL